MPRYALADDTYNRLAPLLPGKQGDRGHSARDNRLFLDAIHFMAHNGGPWRDLPERFGRWNSVFRRFDRWSKNGTWQRLFEALQDPDLAWLMLDTTTVRAHVHAAGARKKGLLPRRQPCARRSVAAVAG